MLMSESADSVGPMIVGRIMIPRRRDAASQLVPVPPNVFLISGTISTSPKNPYTIEGTPAISSIPDFSGR